MLHHNKASDTRFFIVTNDDRHITNEWRVIEWVKRGMKMKGELK